MTVLLEVNELRASANTPQIAPYARGKRQKTQMYPLQMMHKPNQPFNKIAPDLITDPNVSTQETSTSSPLLII